MRRNTLAATLGCAAVLTGALGLGYATHVNADPRFDRGNQQVQRDRDVEMRQALTNLRQVEFSLDHAPRDYNGHRVKALKLTRDAIKEVERGLQSDRRRERDRDHR
jgi:hypothetical protein